MHYQYILFDLDGTITESGPGIMNSVRYAVQKMGFPELPKETLRKFVGPPLADSMQKYCGMTPAEAKEGIACYREYYTSKGIFENSLYPGVEDMLKRLQKGGKILALATSKPEQFAKQILEYFHIDDCFTVVCGASMDEKLVEKAAIITCALQALGIDEAQKKDVLMVGDREHDVLGAKANGLDALGVLYGYGNLAELKDAGAAYIARTAEEAADMILAESQETSEPLFAEPQESSVSSLSESQETPGPSPAESEELPR
ncbi:haloacid dehalogenase-like hydrolase [Marvinbryantia formatexigens DSM 14469]|uniref:Haloacid dehalogenase-like hydrolase n=1 Tax=Marvinbryantia formatexigens DSM 14469 TaxID=478749 RepID=C6LCD9_9FIRM|nr:HAD family hydrolase [Marvinbryantia formatexigens]EET61603.1 haloacid dehalogenase-like hydrolase [Marvinbryantia formatexigens DSM 14469]SDF13666.1 phosphoglycolate phosphatase [Marvinbryantia formatexigens]